MDASKAEGLLEKMLEWTNNVYQANIIPHVWAKLTHGETNNLSQKRKRKKKGINRWSLSNLRPLELEL